MPRTKSFLKAVLLFVVLALLAIGGKEAGKQVARSGILHRVAPVGKAHAGEAEPRSPISKEPADADRVASSIKRLNALLDGSPNLYTDWDTQARMDAIIEKLNPAELAEVFGRLGRDPDESWSLRLLLTKVGAAWMAKDPDAAFRAALEKMPQGAGYLARTAFGTWAQDHPAEALAWLDSAEMPEDPARFRDQLRGHVVTGLLERDFELATAGGQEGRTTASAR